MCDKTLPSLLHACTLKSCKWSLRGVLDLHSHPCMLRPCRSCLLAGLPILTEDRNVRVCADTHACIDRDTRMHRKHARKACMRACSPFSLAEGFSFVAHHASSLPGRHVAVPLRQTHSNPPSNCSILACVCEPAGVKLWTEVPQAIAAALAAAAAAATSQDRLHSICVCA